MDIYHYINLGVEYNDILFVQSCRLSHHLLSFDSSCDVFSYRYGMCRRPATNPKQQRNDVSGTESHFQRFLQRAAKTGDPKRYVLSLGKRLGAGF